VRRLALVLGQLDRPLPCVSLQEDGVDLLQREPPRLDHGEPYDEDSDEIEDGKDDVRLPAQFEQGGGQGEAVETYTGQHRLVRRQGSWSATHVLMQETPLVSRPCMARPFALFS
jgi:hypothetical protein